MVDRAARQHGPFGGKFDRGSSTQSGRDGRHNILTVTKFQFRDLFATWDAQSQPERADWAKLPALPDELAYGFSTGTDYQIVCANCVTDAALRRFAFTRAPSDHCHFCGDSSEMQSDIDDLFEYVYRCLLREYEDPDTSHLLYDKDEGEWFGVDVLDTGDVLHYEGSPLGDSTELHALFCAAVRNDWYVIDSEVGTVDQRFIWSWGSFKERIQAGPRFLFDQQATAAGEFSATSLFGYLDTCAAQLQGQLVKVADPGLTLYRARKDESTSYSQPGDLGPPPETQTRAQRMSAEGVSVFYGSEDQSTAVMETRPDPSELVSVGQWASTKPIRYFDLGTPLPVPSLFDASFAHTRPFSRFCNSFASEVSTPLPADAVPANEYLATQVLTEHLRWKLPTYGGQGVDAIRYPSTFSGEANWVVFVGPEACGPPGFNLLLELLGAFTQGASEPREMPNLS